MKKKSKKPTLGEKLRDAAEQKAQIAARVAPERKKFVIKKVYKEGSPGFERKKTGITLTAIKKSINEPNAIVTVMLDDAGNPTGETETTAVKPSRAMKRLRRAAFVQRGLIGHLPCDTDRRYTRRRNNRCAAVGTRGTKPPKKTWHRSASAKVETKAVDTKTKRRA